MFNGIVKKIGIVISALEQNGGVKCVVDTRMKRRWKKGESVLINGVCSTVTTINGSRLTFFFMEETLKRTTTRHYIKGTRVNIEPALRAGDDLSGHILSGHVDGVGGIASIENIGKMTMITVSAQKEILRYVVEKGSVALDGISLTIASVRARDFSVAIIPYTLKHTILGLKKKGDFVNIEVDVMGKYFEKLNNR